MNTAPSFAGDGRRRTPFAFDAMSSAGAAAAAMTLAVAARQAGKADGEVDGILWLSLGALVGIFYTLGTEKYLRAMQHRHLYVRMSMLFLAALVWVGAAAALTVICVNIFRHSRPDTVEGFERVLGALIPAVVRADLIVDWARRVSWALMNFRSWTGAMVQFQRVTARAPTLPRLTLSRDARGVVLAVLTAPVDFAQAENTMWGEDADALVRVKEILKHFQKLARFTLYAVLAFFGAIPAACVWAVYAVFKSLHSAQQGFGGYAVMYAVSILFAPFAALIVLLGSAALVVGVVSLSVVGTLIQFGVYWSTRVMYSMVRAALSEQWAGFPLGTANRPKGDAADVGPAAARVPDEAGAAMARMGALFPTELEFALAPWDGSVGGDDKRADKVDHLVEDDDKSLSEKKQNDDPEDGAGGGLYTLVPVVSGSRRTSSSGSEPGTGGKAPPAVILAAAGAIRVSARERHLALMARLGLDAAADTRRKRRLSTYYMLGMFVHMQVESGGKAWCLEQVPELRGDAFRSRLDAFDSFVVTEAAEAGDELADRLRRMSKYRIVHSGSENEDLVPVKQWIRALLLFLLDTPWDPPAAAAAKELDEFPSIPLPVATKSVGREKDREGSSGRRKGGWRKSGEAALLFPKKVPTSDVFVPVD